MNYTGPDGSLNRICIFCHAPHNAYRLASAAGTGAGPVADAAYNYLPLWNHQLPNAVPTYQMYENGPGAPLAGSNASQAIAQTMKPGNVSLLCLSCHDGSIAVNSYGNSDQPVASVGAGGKFISSQYQIGKDSYLGNHHPIGFDYDNVKALDTDIRDADATQLTSTSLIRDHLFGNGQTGATASQSYLECATCHSVHNKGNKGEKLLWRSDQNSQLCLTCHNKGVYTPAQ